MTAFEETAMFIACFFSIVFTIFAVMFLSHPERTSIWGLNNETKVISEMLGRKECEYTGGSKCDKKSCYIKYEIVCERTE